MGSRVERARARPVGPRDRRDFPASSPAAQSREEARDKCGDAVASGSPLRSALAMRMIVSSHGCIES